MKIGEMPLSAYYHKYIVLKDENGERHCVCCADRRGRTVLAVLQDGEVRKCLGLHQVLQSKVEFFEPDLSTRMAGKTFMEEEEANTDEDVLQARSDSRLDAVRNPFYPDQIAVGIIKERMMREYDAEIVSFCGPFLKCRLLEETDTDLDIGDILYAAPYEREGGEIRMYAMFSDHPADVMEKKAFEKILHVSNEYGITFAGKSLKS